MRWFGIRTRPVVSTDNHHGGLESDDLALQCVDLDAFAKREGRGDVPSGAKFGSDVAAA